MEHPDFSKAFQPQQSLDTNFGAVTMTVHTIGELVLSSGKLVACDPLAEPDTEPFRVKFKPGRYPVMVSVAHIEKTNERRVAYAMLRLSDRPPVRWELATVSGEDINSLEEGEIFGYGVDSGTGCFMDAKAADSVAEIEINSGEQDFAEKLIEELEKNRAQGNNWAVIPIDKAAKFNIVAFDSGWGDGIYATYFGYDAEKNVAQVITDFELFG